MLVLSTQAKIKLAVQAGALHSPPQLLWRQEVAAEGKALLLAVQAGLAPALAHPDIAAVVAARMAGVTTLPPVVVVVLQVTRVQAAMVQTMRTAVAPTALAAAARVVLAAAPHRQAAVVLEF